MMAWHTFLFTSTVAAMLLVCLVTLGNSAMDLGVSPPKVDLEVRGGQQQELTVSVKNHGETPIRVVPELNDFRLNEDGKPEVLKAGSLKNSCTGWLKVSLASFVLQGGADREIPLTIKPSRGIRGGYYCGLLFEASQERAQKSSVEIGLRTGTLFLLDAAHTGRYKAEINSLQGKKVGSSQAEFELVVSNKGTTHISPNVQLVVLSRKKRRVYARLLMAGGTATILPGGTRKFHCIWEMPAQFSAGDTVARAVVRAKRLRLQQELPLAELKHAAVVPEGIENSRERSEEHSLPVS